MCRYTEIVKMVPMFKNYVENLKKIVPNMPIECPFQKQKFEFRNITIGSLNESIVDKNCKSIIPNGLHRTILNFYTREDPVGVSVQWIISQKNRLIQDKFQPNFGVDQRDKRSRGHKRSL